MPTLSKQLKMLTDAYVKTRKRSSGGRPTAWATLTAKGRRALKGHLAALRELATRAE